MCVCVCVCACTGEQAHNVLWDGDMQVFNTHTRTTQHKVKRGTRGDGVASGIVQRTSATDTTSWIRKCNGRQ